MVQPADDFGLPTQAQFPTDILAGLFPWMTYGPNLALSLALAQYQGGNQLQGQNIAANAALQGDAMRSQATLGAASIGAQGGIDQQLISTAGQLQGLQASIAADIQRAQGGDQNAANRLQSQLGLQAQLANQQQMLQLAKMGGSGDLRDNFSRMLYLKGFGGQPGLTSALNGLPSPWVTAPNVQFSPYGPAPQVNMKLPSPTGNYNVPSISAPSFGAGGGAGGGNLADIFGSTLSGIGDPLGIGKNPLFSWTPETPGAPTPTPTPTQTGSAYPGPTGSAYSGNVSDSGNWAQMAINAGNEPLAKQIMAWRAQTGPAPSIDDILSLKPIYGMAGGGTLSGGQSALVGERGPEIVTIQNGRVIITPLTGAYQYGGTFPAHKKAIPLSTATPPGGVTEPAGTPVTVPGSQPAQRTPVGAPMTPATSPLNQIGGLGVSANPNELPFLQQLRSGIVSPAFTGGIQQPSFPELGIGPVPLPFQAANTFGRMSSPDQQSAMQLWQAMGIPPEVAAQWIAFATPGFRFGAPRPTGF